jgi:hypothetical protein
LKFMGPLRPWKKTWLYPRTWPQMELNHA